MEMVEQEVEWMLGDEHGRDENARKVHQVLDWMHAQPAPRACVVRAVVQTVHVPVQPPTEIEAGEAAVFRKVAVHQTMGEEEVAVTHEQHPSHTPEGRLPKVNVECCASCGPQVQHHALVCRRDQGSTGGPDTACAGVVTLAGIKAAICPNIAWVELVALQCQSRLCALV
eukprot:CAMPEP_0117599908 /NCGR_PEP_ID=MMETSP0784-20121206/76198_1 /TAXON_ID=39447 /ORGANISM="" /LENGTH=169 /DNA_ID=CAMNT_0005402491 /DNA_START=283 /DNA_END=792 /DNA_ORIENTATION=+